jgi:hypothetical protein
MEFDQLEEWRDVPGYEGEYQASSQGRLRSLDRDLVTNNQYGRCVKSLKGKVLAPAQNAAGYFFAAFKGHTVAVHRMVCLAYHGYAPDGKWIAAHRDDDRTNNAPSNLYWASPSENGFAKVRNGLHSQANQTHCKRGHQFTKENTYLPNSGGRMCRACHRRWSRDYSRKMRATNAV